MTNKYKIRVRPTGHYMTLKGTLTKKYGLTTVCEEALCPNIWDCWGRGTATFMILGDTCTRNCRFCYVKTGRPSGIDKTEPLRVALAVKEMGIDYVTITSVTRDDLSDGGAGQFSETVKKIKEVNPNIIVEVLTPDFWGRRDLIEKVIRSGIDVFSHNIETVKKLSPYIRDRRFSYELSLKVLSIAREIKQSLVLKSSILLGLGESINDIIEAMEDLYNIGVDIVVLGQYLRPSTKQEKIHKVYTKQEYEFLEKKGYEIGFSYVVAHPLARTSYKAREAYMEAVKRKK